ncbi:MAG: nucleotidyltransferase domain-containing protein [SAR324 cluster bacterium]|nr:nucleotidyltransferase domain-containing protein [SAR324 cluster bacterium]
MLLDKDRQIATIFRDRLKQITPILEFKVFGSRVRGDFTEESDLDIYVKTVSMNNALRYQISDLAWEIGFENDRVIGTFVTTESQIRQGAQGANPLIAQIEKEGVEV